MNNKIGLLLQKFIIADHHQLHLQLQHHLKLKLTKFCSRHGWYHQATRNAVGKKRPNLETHGWAMTIKKSKDHIGYGNGMIGYGDVQATSLDSNSPSWMFGMRMVPGVVGSGMPRWNYCQIEDGKLNVKPRYFQRGPNMSELLLNWRSVIKGGESAI